MKNKERRLTKNTMMTIKNIKDIIKAKFFTNKKKMNKVDWYVERKSICNKCPLNSKNISKTKWTKRMWVLWVMNFFKQFCSKCGCEILAKISLPFSECPHNPPKWKEL